MYWGRYLLAIAVGLAVGMAIGWYSGHPDGSQPLAAGLHHHHSHHHRRSQSVGVHSPKHSPDSPAPKPPPPAHVPTMRELQQQMLQCVLGHPLPAGQVACLRAVLRHELDVAPDPWSGPGANGLSLPFALLGQD